MYRLLAAFFSLIAIANIEFTAKANDDLYQSGYETRKLSENEYEIRYSNFHSGLTLLTEEPPRRMAECYAVDESGNFALGFNTVPEKTICVYSADGKFQYGIVQDFSGAFGLELNGDIISIYYARSDFLVTYNRDGQILDIVEVMRTSGNNRLTHILFYSPYREVGGYTYNLKKDPMGRFFPVRSTLIRTDGQGDETVLYETEQDEIIRLVLINAGIICGFFILLFVNVRFIVKTFKERKVKKQT